MQNSPGSLLHYDYVSLYETSFKTRRGDIRFFVGAATACSGAVLEYGAGAGRVTLPLAKAGCEVVAVDASGPMVQRLKDHLAALPKKVSDRVDVKKGDMRRLRLGRRFPLVLATFNVVGHLPTFRDFGAFLKRVKEHLEPGGQLIFDVPIPHPDEVEADPEELFPVPRFKHPDTGQWIRQTERFEYNPLTQALLVESVLKVEGAPDPLTIPLVLRQWFPKEVEAILLYEGFSKVEILADYSEQPAILAEDTLVFRATL